MHDANAISSTYAQCHICCMAVPHNGIHCIRAMQCVVHWIPYCMNAMHLVWQHPSATGNTLVRYGTQCIHAKGRAVLCDHIPTGAFHVMKQKNKSRQIWNKLYALNSNLWREILYLSLWATQKVVWKNPRLPCCSPVISIVWTDITYLWWIVIIHSTASVPCGTRKWETLKKTCISGVCCADSSTGRARRCILFLPAFRERNWKRHFPWRAGVTILFFDLSGTVNSPGDVLAEMVRTGTRNSRWHVEWLEWQTKTWKPIRPPQKKMECDKNKGAFGRVWTRRMPLCVYSFLCTAYLKIGFESNIL